MQKPSESDHPARRLDARASLQLVLNANANGEISPALEIAFGLAGPHAKSVTLPTEFLLAEQIEGTALLIRGRQAAVVWCSSGSLTAIGRIASKFSAHYAANWEGLADLRTPIPIPDKATGKTQGGSSHPGFPKLFSLLLLFGLALGVSTLHADNIRSTLPLVRSGAALGDNLLERFGVAAKTAGYDVDIADVRGQSDGIQLLIPGLVLTPPADHLQKPIRFAVVIPIGRGERLSVSIRAITRPKDQLPEGSAIRIVLRQVLDDKVVTDQTTKLSRGWSTPGLDWVADRDRAAGELVVEIIPAFSGPLKVALPQALLLPAVTTK